MMNTARITDENPTQSAPKTLNSLEDVRAHFDLQLCLVVDEERQILNAAQAVPTPFAGVLAEVAPTLALLPECRDLHLNHLRKTFPKLANSDVTSRVFKGAGRRYFICALGPDAQEKGAAIERAVISGLV